MTAYHTIDRILGFWFGKLEEMMVPSEDRARIWFGASEEIDKEINTQFSADLEAARAQEYEDWKRTPRGQLALIILCDQFSRHIYRDTVDTFAQDAYAVDICTHGIEQRQDHELSLIERVFYYFPLFHSESLMCQERSVQQYEQLVSLAFPETKMMYERFLQFSIDHYRIIKKFGRFPQRNLILKRESTDAERQYLKEMQRLRGQSDSA